MINIVSCLENLQQINALKVGLGMDFFSDCSFYAMNNTDKCRHVRGQMDDICLLWALLNVDFY